MIIAGKPLIRLTCTCCGKGFKGRQWWNQDRGYGLGNCCLYLVSQGMTKEDLEETYGVMGNHINAGPLRS